MSLAHLLDSQPDSCVTHEACPLPWEFDAQAWDFMSQKLLGYQGEIIGDVGYYWINYVDSLLDILPQAVFVCLKREKDEVIISMWDYSRGLNVNPADPWYRMYPLYNADRKTAIGMMWDDYYEIAETMKNKYPDIFKIVSMNDLNTDEGVSSILRFVGMPDNIQNRIVGIKANAGKS